MKPGNWVVAAGTFLLLTTLTFGYGLWHTLVLDKREFCTVILHQRYDPKYALSDEQLFPLSQKCNASYDMVPAFVNPSIVLFLGLTILGAGAGVGAAVRRRRAAFPR
ncbi:hypothetical protein [Streptomyces sp. MI02-7b]|uniref:hypothetical protein n=1 Tax=Streptomyces sp. MI02-7b TaxID=462941 RepID=UPI0029A37878|nr:hypothetical protein [Streptomyces sp. MI02-7b]MDX3076284.1 hypothetical protein [Streptomyces sp. MI02-7b]